MIPALAWLVCGALVFVEQDMPGVRVGRAEPLSGERWRNFRQADFDGDGKTDLLLPDCVAFQRGDAFRSEDRQPLPPVSGLPACDLWDTTLYMRLPSGLACFQWSPGGWQTLLEQPLPWPDSESARQEPDASQTGGPAAIHFERFLHDFNQDGRPEIVVTTSAGLHVFTDSDGRYAPAGVLDVLPPLRLLPVNPAPVWPPGNRRIPAPESQRSCRLFISQNRVSVLESDLVPEDRVQHRIRQFEIAANRDGRLEAKPLDMQETPILPGALRPCRLNPDDAIDFGGGQWQFTPGGLLHAPIYETYVSTDGGNTVQSVRSISYRPGCCFVDFNGDARLDLITESSGLFEGGVRETVTRLMTARTLKHDIHVHLQDANGAFPVAPTVRGSFHLNIENVPARSGERFRRYQASELTNLTGDFDGDGIHDAVIHADPRGIAIFRGSMDGFSSRPIMAAETQPHWRFAVDDIDGDGRSDLVFRWMDPASADGYEQCRVFLTREKAP